MPTTADTDDLLSLKQTLAKSLRARLQQKGVSIAAFAKQIGTGRTAIRRLLDEKNTSITFHTMSKAARALGLRIVLQAEPMSPEELGFLAEKLSTAPTPAEANRLKAEIMAGFYGDEVDAQSLT